MQIKCCYQADRRKLREELIIILEDLIRETLYLDQDTEILDSHGPGQLDGWDSLGHANLMFALESTFGISLNLDEILAIESVSDVKNVLADKGVDLE